MDNNSESSKRVKIEVIEDGPLRITGKFILKDLKRNGEETLDFIELCRCGRTKNKPYCDNSCKKPE